MSRFCLDVNLPLSVSGVLKDPVSTCAYKRSVKLALNGFSGGTKLYPCLAFGRSLPFVGEFHTCSVRIGNLAPPRRYCPRSWDTFRFLACAEMGWPSSFLRCSYDDAVVFFFFFLRDEEGVHIAIFCVHVFRSLLLDTVQLLPFTFRLYMKLPLYPSTT